MTITAKPLEAEIEQRDDGQCVLELPECEALVIGSREGVDRIVQALNSIGDDLVEMQAASHEIHTRKRCGDAIRSLVRIGYCPSCGAGPGIVCQDKCPFEDHDPLCSHE